MNILGINAYHPDASAALIVDGKLVAAVEEERFTRVKHYAGFPTRSIAYCLEAAGIGLHQVDHIAIPRNPRARLATKLLYALRIPELAMKRSKAIGDFARIKDTLAAELEVDKARVRAPVHRIEHHLAHLASSFFVSPFDSAALLSLDGLGDFGSGMWGVGEGNKIKPWGTVAFPHSVGMYYTAITQYLGFWGFGDEYKVMGLASYGEPEWLNEFRDVIQTTNGLGYRMNLRYFQHQKTGPMLSWRDGYPYIERLFSEELEQRFGATRKKEEPIEQRHINLASTMQARLEEVVMHQWDALQKKSGKDALAYAGGVAYNCVANGKIFDHTRFKDIYVAPAAGDAGLAIGAAFYVWHQVLDQPRSFVMDHAYWGPEYSNAQIDAALAQYKLDAEVVGDDELYDATAREIAAGKVVGWFQGRAEWGPRALGNRSIVADPRNPDMREILNRRIKRRETFRPFAPSILEEYTGEYFEKSYPSPFMLMAYEVRPEKRGEIPAPTHVDGTGRLQTVSKSAAPHYWRLIDAFRLQTGVPVVLNTSFNENEPVVCNPQEAIDCFIRTKMDVLAIGNRIVRREAQD